MRINHATLALGTLVGLACAAAIAVAPASYASAEPIPGGGGAAPAIHHLARTIVDSGGLPTWQVAFIAVGAALLGAAATMLARWGRTRRLSPSLRAS